LESYSQDPCEGNLLNHLRNKYPGANYQISYEAGFCGFGIQRFLKKWDFNCIIINPTDVPASVKDKKRKSDKIDARKISRELANCALEGIYVPTVEMEHTRTLVRQRDRLVQDQTRCKNRIWHMLMFSGLRLDTEKSQKYWSRRFLEMQRQMPCKTQPVRYALNTAIEEYLQIRKLLSQTTKQVRILSQQGPFIGVNKLLLSIPVIWIVNAMITMTELQDMRRSKTLDKLCYYVGIVPDTDSSGINEKVKGLAHRSNRYLRPAIVESSWVIIRKDPAMLHLYKKYCQKMVPNKAIIKISRQLLSRIRYVSNSRVEYEIGLVG